MKQMPYQYMSYVYRYMCVYAYISVSAWHKVENQVVNNIGAKY